MSYKHNVENMSRLYFCFGLSLNKSNYGNEKGPSSWKLLGPKRKETSQACHLRKILPL
jgi:hypothetical protein